MARSKAVLGDARRDARSAWMFDRIVTSGSLVLREIGGTRSGEVGAHRLLSSDDVDPGALLMPHVARTAAACKGRRIVAAQDTTEINFDRFRQPLPASDRPVTPISEASSFIPSWPSTTRPCSTCWAHGSGCARRSRHRTIAALTSRRKRAGAGSMLPRPLPLTWTVGRHAGRRCGRSRMRLENCTTCRSQPSCESSSRSQVRS